MIYGMMTNEGLRTMESFLYYYRFALSFTKLEVVSVFPKFGFYREGPT